VCLACKHVWVAVAHGRDHWHCQCGNDLFHATPAGMYCPNCGEWQI
jgi:hypothetical protein